MGKKEQFVFLEKTLKIFSFSFYFYIIVYILKKRNSKVANLACFSGPFESL